jgi:2'-5' RNA ligase
VRKPVTDRFFMAVIPDADVRAEIVDLRKRLRIGHELTGPDSPPEILHVTLQVIAEGRGMPGGLVELATAMASRVTIPPFRAVFDQAGSFGGGRAFVLSGEEGVVGFELLRQQLEWPIEQKYTPHMTLLYDERRIPRHPVSPISWTVREFVLVHSLVGRTQHVHLKRWALK